MKERWNKRADMRICVFAMAIYIFLVFAFHFLAGEQLLYRQSRENILLPVAETGAGELTQDVVMEQVFAPKIQRLEAVGVQVSTAYRQNQGTVTLELVDLSNENVLLSNQFDVSTLEDGQVLTITTETPIEGLYDKPLMLRLTADSVAGTAIIPLMNTEGHDDEELLVNGTQAEGTLCFTATGEEYIWTGVHYWEFAAVGGLLTGNRNTASL